MEALLRGGSLVLERIARGEPLPAILWALTASVERVAPNLRCSVLLFDAEHGRLLHGAAPSLPEFYNQAIDRLPVGPDVGSCGAAAFSGRRVIVEDVREHPNWRVFLELAERAEIRACWSEPVRSSTGEVLGTFALYYRVPRGPAEFELEIIRQSAHIAGIAIERARAKDELRASEERFRQVTEAIREVFWLTDWQLQKVLYVSPAYQEIWGRTPESLIEDPKSWAYDIHPEDRAVAVEAFRKANEGGYEVEYRLCRADGSVRWIYDRAFPIYDSDGRPYRVAGISEDITERKQNEHALREANARLDAMSSQKLRSLTSELLLAEESERRKLAIDLHDSLGQLLVLARMRIANLRAAVPKAASEDLEALDAILAQASQSVRSATFQLSPPVLHDLGFEPAVEWLVEEIRRDYRLKIRLERGERQAPLEERVKVLLFRAVRELLINVAKHARAREAAVFIVVETRSVQISVRDDGRAFEPSSRGQRGLGLRSIAQRLENLGGHMRIDSQPGDGTEVVLVAPLARPTLTVQST